MPASQDLRLRPASASDEIAIHRLVREGRINPLGIRWPRFAVVESPEGEIIACGQVKPHRDGTRELASIVVTRIWRGRGLARRIIEHLLEREQGPVYLICRPELGPLYARFGFRPVPDEALPPFFRRLKRLVRLPELLAGLVMLIMVWEGPGA